MKNILFILSVCSLAFLASCSTHSVSSSNAPAKEQAQPKDSGSCSDCDCCDDCGCDTCSPCKACDRGNGRSLPCNKVEKHDRKW